MLIEIAFRAHSGVVWVDFLLPLKPNEHEWAGNCVTHSQQISVLFILCVVVCDFRSQIRRFFVWLAGDGGGGCFVIIKSLVAIKA